MANQYKTIANYIEETAKLTGAGEPFTEQVKALFLKKGISLDGDVEPYMKAIEEAFQRELSIRSTSARAQESITQLRQNFSKVGKAYTKQIEQLKKIQSRLQAQTRRLMQQQNSGSKSGTGSVAIRGDHRSYVTKPEREELPLVPGPKEIQ
jgi:hypothetical protein